MTRTAERTRVAISGHHELVLRRPVPDQSHPSTFANVVDGFRIDGDQASPAVVMHRRIDQPPAAIANQCRGERLPGRVREFGIRMQRARADGQASRVVKHAFEIGREHFVQPIDSPEFRRVVPADLVGGTVYGVRRVPGTAMPVVEATAPGRGWAKAASTQ